MNFSFNYFYVILLLINHLLSYQVFSKSINNISSNFLHNKQKSNTKVKMGGAFLIENKGQWHKDVLFLFNNNGVNIWITNKGMNITLRKADFQSVTASNDDYTPLSFKINKNKKNVVVGHRVIFEYEGNNNFVIEKKGQFDSYYNYILGDKSENYVTYVRLYKEVILKNFYDGIDLRYYVDGFNLRYDFIIHPYYDINKIKFRIKGSQEDYLENGNLISTIPFGKIIISDLKSNQENKKIDIQFIKKGEFYHFSSNSYDYTNQFLIEPLIYCTLLGGYGEDVGYKIASNSTGNVYVVGTTNSNDFDITPGAFQTTNKFTDGFITKFDATGSNIIFSTFIGGNDTDEIIDIHLDASGNIVFGASTMSKDFPYVSGSYKSSLANGTDFVIGKLNNNGTNLIFSSIIGGSDVDDLVDFDVDPDGNILALGYTYSNDMIISTLAIQKVLKGKKDLYFCILDKEGNKLNYSTYLGGSENDLPSAVKFSTDNFVYLAGTTESNDFPLSDNAFRKNFGGIYEGFVVKLKKQNDIYILNYSTFLGGKNNEIINDIDCDDQNNLVIVGSTDSDDFPITNGVIQSTFSSGIYRDGFVTIFKADGSAPLYSTFIGKNGQDDIYSVKVGPDNKIYVCGNTYSQDFYVTANAYQSNLDGLGDAFIMMLNNSLNNILYSTYLGGSDEDAAYDLCIDTDSKYVFIVGQTYSFNFDVTPNAFQTILANSRDVFVAKIDVVSQINSIQNNLTKNKLNWIAFPNPNNGNFYIKSNQFIELELVDISGRIIGVINSNGMSNINKIGLPAGIYFIREKSTNKAQKIIIHNSIFKGLK